MPQHDPLKSYSYHKPSPSTGALIGIIRNEHRNLAKVIIANVPESREKSLALTHLENARMYAILALSMHSEGSEVVPDDEPQGLSGGIAASA